MPTRVSEINMTFREDHPDRLAISHALLRIQQQDGGAPPLSGYDPEEVLVSGPELLLLVSGLAIGDGGKLVISGRPLNSWCEAKDRSFACIAPMLRGTMKIVDEPNNRTWEWYIADGLLSECSVHRDPTRSYVITPFK